MYPNAQGRSRWWVPPHSHSPPQCVAHSSGNSNSRAVRSHVYPAPSASSPRKKACVSARSAVGRSAGSQDNILRTSRSAQRETPTPVGSLAASCAISASSVHSHDSSAATSDRGGMTQSSSMARMRTASSRVSSPAPRRRRSMPARTRPPTGAKTRGVPRHSVSRVTTPRDQTSYAMYRSTTPRSGFGFHAFPSVFSASAPAAAAAAAPMPSPSPPSKRNSGGA